MEIPQPQDPESRVLLQIVWDELTAGDHWPRYDVVDRILHSVHGLDIEAVRERLADDLLLGGRRAGGAPPSPDGQLRLTVAGAAVCTGSQEALNVFLAALRLAIDVEGRDPRRVTEPTVKADAVLEGAADGVHVGADPAAAVVARCAGLLLAQEPWVDNVSLYEGGWQLRPNRTVRRFRGLEDVSSYWIRRHEVLDALAAKSQPVHAADSRTTEGAEVPGGRSIFVVHGREDARKQELLRLLERTTDREVVVLHEQPNRGATILEKFERHANEAGVAVVLLTGDDEGRLRGTVAEPALRGRQNVIFELGVFFGRLGRSSVVVLVDGGVERPSDLDGLVYIELDASGAWRVNLLKELESGGVEVDWHRIP